MEDFERIYGRSLRASQNLIEDIRFRRNINLEPMFDCIDLICDFMNGNTNVFALLNSVQNKNPYLYSHPVNVTFLAYDIGKWLNLTKAERYQLACAAFLHDIGKAKIADRLLNKSEKLSDVELETVHNHPMAGFKILKELNILENQVLQGVLQHHERVDGSGYPYGFKGNQICLFGRIIAIADSFDAITATKAYHMKSSPFKAVEEIEACGYGTLDPYICQVFLNHIINCYYGSVVLLSNEKVGKVVFLNPEDKTRPLICCEEEFFDLSKERNIEIVDVYADQ